MSGRFAVEQEPSVRRGRARFPFFALMRHELAARRRGDRRSAARTGIQHHDRGTHPDLPRRVAFAIGGEARRAPHELTQPGRQRARRGRDEQYQTARPPTDDAPPRSTLA
jgi:hypothetical protein